MKVLIPAAFAAALGVAGFAAPASAVTFAGAVADVNTHTGDPGGTAVSASNLAVLGFDLTALNQVFGPTNLFKLTINEDIGSNDEVADPISVTLSFTQPGSQGGVVSGTTTGVNNFFEDSLVVSWLAPISLVFDDGTQLLVTLANTTIQCGFFSSCNGDNANVQGSFKLTALPTVNAVPLPGAFPLFASGLGLVAYLARKRRRRGSRIGGELNFAS